MTYSNHNLRTDLQEWKNRLYKAPYEQFSHQLKFFLSNLFANKQLYGILHELTLKHDYSADQLEKISEQIMRDAEMSFDSDEHQASFCLQFLTFFTAKHSYELTRYYIVTGSNFEEKKGNIIEVYISPILNVLHDKLNHSNSTIYLLEKYKRRTEWFTKKGLYHKYKSVDKNYEQIFEDDLRLFLFDQGVDYPFSTPNSASGRADIVGEIETDDPLVIEIKIFDRGKNYGLDRIRDGFNQIVQYSNDYNKNVGYLVIFNMDKVELNFKFSEANNVFPPSIQFNNKVFYFVVINSVVKDSASKSGTMKEIVIMENQLTKNS